ncbi:hypothetical protein DH2020_029229 [Rehmannia glutinosa]|uniref:DUF3741 domain-containing protein n=1 Tax=Rehmannia glutinosa TaxID=99300 RepID=A0ABR0VP76_REHGL
MAAISGRKHEKLMKPLSPTKAKLSSSTAKNSLLEDKIEKQNFDSKRLRCGIKVPIRSPTLPPEIRRSNAATSPLVARLMGLDEDLGAKKPDHHISDKRQRLLQALEKCNEDLEALKRIIKAVQTIPGAGGNSDQEPNIPAGGGPLSSISMLHISSTAGTLVSNVVPQQRKPTAAKKPGEDYEPIAKLVNKSSITESSLHVRRQVTPPSCSRAMVQSVEEVCDDIAWGEKREIGRIGMVLQDHLWRELIHELVKDLKSSCSNIRYSLPLEACKRSLCF